MTKHYQPSKWKTIYLANMFFFSGFQATSHHGFHHLNPFAKVLELVLSATPVAARFRSQAQPQKKPGGWHTDVSEVFENVFWGEKSSYILLPWTSTSFIYLGG